MRFCSWLLYGTPNDNKLGCTLSLEPYVTQLWSCIKSNMVQFIYNIKEVWHPSLHGVAKYYTERAKDVQTRLFLRSFAHLFKLLGYNPLCSDMYWWCRWHNIKLHFKLQQHIQHTMGLLTHVPFKSLNLTPRSSVPKSWLYFCTESAEIPNFYKFSTSVTVQPCGQVLSGIAG